MKPILLNTEMVRAILEGRKTVTRRVVKPQPLFKTSRKFVFADEVCPKKWEDCSNIIATYRYKPGDILYVRETWAEWEGGYQYKADDFLCGRNSFIDRWRPSIHMPKEAARLFLRVKAVQVERLQDITEEQCAAEGVGHYWVGMGESGYSISADCKTSYEGPIGAFVFQIWEKTIKPADLPLYGWTANPWVWVIEFERVSGEEVLGGGGDVR